MTTAASELHFLRYVPGTSPVHKMWAGTKLLVVAGIGIAVVAVPTWPAQAIAFAVLAAALITCRVSLTAAPRPPLWFFYLLAFAGFLALTAGGKPEIHTPALTLGFGGLIDWIRFTTLTVVVLGFAVVLGWTTHLADLGPALTRLFAPLRLVRAPVDEVVAAVTLCVRCLPLLVDELRTLYAVRRLRHPEVPTTMKGEVLNLHDLLVGALVSAMRRAREMADAIDGRGGVGPAPRLPVHLHLPDYVALITTAAAIVGIVVI
ncbi:MAG: energy-coupling factor transporter transmembrane protein EcfT [Acidimicrobiia bacterium]|nr:energy-coupling factor transporter transmembrane protein EcfT [Acidimicrobiia bacterium]